jgi:acylphosphatase
MVREASRLDVKGWVRNRHDGSVEAVVQGAPAAVEQLVAWARQGPPSAKVTDVQVSEDTGEFSSFEQRPTV